MSTLHLRRICSFTSILVLTASTVFAQVDVMQKSSGTSTVQPKPAVKIPGIDFEESSTRKTPVVEELEETVITEAEIEKPVIETEALLEELSSFQKYLMGQIPLEVSRRVDHFGYNFFRQPPQDFTPVMTGPVPAGYVIGPGDEIRINVWGMVEGIWNPVVDRDGNINIPTVGTVSVAGLTYENLENFLKKELSKHYKEFYLNVSMGRLRTIPVYLVGSVRRPGNYTVSSLSTLINALFVSGGPTTTGTMRDIHLKRNGATIVRFDMYDFILKGDKSKDIRLLPEDVIFVPPAGPMVAVIGQVANPAIYEINKETTLTELIKMAGGVSPTGYTKKVQVERVFENERKILLDKNLSELSGKDDIKLANGDIVVVYPISDTIINAITLTGNVERPGKYEWKEGMRVSDIIKDKALLPETNLDYALIERFQLPTLQRELLFFNLGKSILQKDPAEDKILQPYDIIRVYSLWEVKEHPYVRITGTVHKPGTYLYSENMRVSDLVKLGGGLKYFAYMEEAELTRVTPTPNGPETQRISINLKKALEEDPEHNILLYQDDYLFIRTVPDWQLYEIVTLRGEVQFPGVYTIKKGETITSLIARAGGFTDKAYIRGAVFTREDVRKRQREQMDSMINKLEMELLTSGSSLPPDATEADIKSQQMETARKRDLITTLRTIMPDGRVVISLTDAQTNKVFDMQLQDGDTITIPKNPGIVTVLGAVYNQTSFVYDGSLSYDRYIQMAGGLTPTANKRELYIIKVDGSVVKPGARYTLEPGDAIIAPEKMEIVSARREIRNIIDVLYKTAATVAVTASVF